MIPRIKIADNPIASCRARLTELGCTPEQVRKHIDALSRPKPEPRHHHLSERDGRWEHQLRERPILMDDACANRKVGWKQLVGRGAFKLDPFEHAKSCINDMAQTAINVLKKHGIKPRGDGPH